MLRTLTCVKQHPELIAKLHLNHECPGDLCDVVKHGKAVPCEQAFTQVDKVRSQIWRRGVHKERWKRTSSCFRGNREWQNRRAGACDSKRCELHIPLHRSDSFGRAFCPRHCTQSYFYHQGTKPVPSSSVQHKGKVLY